MAGSQAAAAWVAQLAFWVLLALGIGSGELTRKKTGLFVALWMGGYFGLPRISWSGGMFVTPYVAALDIALVFLVFKGDVRLT